jgi:hypothetical protein
VPLSAVVLWALERAFFGESKQSKSLLLGGFADQSFVQGEKFRILRERLKGEEGLCCALDEDPVRCV